MVSTQRSYLPTCSLLLSLKHHGDTSQKGAVCNWVLVHTSLLEDVILSSDIREAQPIQKNMPADLVTIDSPDNIISVPRSKHNARAYTLPHHC